MKNNLNNASKKFLIISEQKNIIIKVILQNYLQNITKRIDKIFELDSYLNDVGENIEISQYVLHILDNLKQITESEIKLDEYYKQYLENSFGIKFLGEVNNEK